MINPDRVSKLYEPLTNKERATLVFGHLIVGDKQEIEKILASIPLKIYSCSDVEYNEWYDAIWNMSSLYAIEYWQLCARKYKAFFRAWMLDKRKDNEGADEAFEDFMLGDSYLLALDRALVSVCTKHGINTETVKKLANTEACQAIPQLQPDAEMETKYYERLSRLLPN